MGLHRQNATSPQPRVFNFSLDWRFLLPMADPGKVRLLVQADTDFSETLEQVGIHASQQLSFSELRQDKTKDVQSFVMPFGLPVGWVGAKHEDQVVFFSSVRGRIAPDGYLLVGFNNVWNLRVHSKSKHHPSTPRRVTAQLKQAGFRSVSLFGAMPNLAIPEYVFDLDSQAIQFALRNRFRRKPAALQILRALEGTIGLKRISKFLPCYFAVATA